MAEFDCIVVGGGPGGYVAAIRSAQLGMRTAVIERDRLGGRCLNYAWIPAKLMLRTADVVSEAREAGEFGVRLGEPTVDFDAVVARRRKVITGLTGGVGGLLKRNQVTLLAGSARLTGQGAVAVHDDVVVGRVPYSAVGAGSVIGDRSGLVKLVGDAATGELVGGHIVGGKATELVQQLIDVRLLEGGYADLARTIHGHPTLSEALMEAARAADGWLVHG
jgi:pyruvate/2-oxoglutarate dehydrogenase complex dihydrolipoamide dehydrogenase (E3) component